MRGAPNDFPSLKPGGHVCLPYAKDEERRSAISAFVHDGLLRGERCLYYGNVADFEAIVPHLALRGIPVAALRDRGTLVFAEAAPAGSRAFDAEGQVASIRAAAAAARSEGYAGLRVAGDPDAKIRASIDSEQLAAFEILLSKIYDDVRATGLCTFDQRATDSSSSTAAWAFAVTLRNAFSNRTDSAR